MSPREQTERVQRSLRPEREPLAETQARFETAMRSRAGRWLVYALLGVGTSWSAKETGALDAVAVAMVGTSRDARTTTLEKKVNRLGAGVGWLIQQEVRRQERECVAAGYPPQSCRVDPPDLE